MKGQPRNVGVEDPGCAYIFVLTCKSPPRAADRPATSAPDVGVIGTAGGEVVVAAECARHEGGGG